MKMRLCSTHNALLLSFETILLVINKITYTKFLINKRHLLEFETHFDCHRAF